jgi:iron complex transport system substrate-binding protein
MVRAILILASALLFAGCGGESERAAAAPDLTGAPLRIVSLAPSLTETLYALGVGDRVVGVTRYCAHPPAVSEVPKIGGHLDPNFEAIVSLEPDLVVAIPSSREQRMRLEGLGLRVLEVDQHDVVAVLDSIVMVADACGVGDRGRKLRSEIEVQLSVVENVVAGASRPRVVIVVGHQAGEGPVRSVWAAGPDTFYDGVIRLAGGVNAMSDGLARYPELSREGLAALDPDVVLDVIAGLEARNLDADDLRRQWMRLVEMRAVREGRIRILEGDHMVVPGPRLPEMVEAVARALHPNLDWVTE